MFLPSISGISGFFHSSSYYFEGFIRGSLRHESGNGGSLSLFEGNGDQLRDNVVTRADGECQERDETPR